MLSHPLKFIEAGTIKLNPATRTQLSTRATLKVFDVYHSNLGQVIGGLALPGFAFGTGCKWSLCTNSVLRAHFGTDHVITQADLDTLPYAVWNKIEHLMADAMTIPVQQQREELGKMTRQFEVFVGRCGESIRASLENVLRSALVLAWMSFETLSEDLLTSILREHAACFTLTGREKWGFRSRRSIRESYESAFSAQSNSILSCLRSDALDALALLRNLIVHRAGNVDRTFLSEARAVSLLAPYRPTGLISRFDSMAKLLAR